MKHVFLAITVFSLNLMAAVNTAEQIQTTTATTTTATAGKTHGVVDFRPSYTSRSGEMHTETAAELGYDFQPGTSAFYRQELTTNLYNPGSVSGVNSTLGDGYLKGTNYNLVPFQGTPFTLGYEGRVYLPTMERKRDAGMLTAIRNYVWLKYQATSSFNVYLAEVPVVHFYNEVGTANAANPVFENKIELVGEYLFTNNLKVVVPFKFSTTKHSSYKVGATNNDAWVNNLYLYPEVHYRLNPNLKVGAAVYTGALTNSTLSGLTLDEGLKNSTFQTFAVVTL